ncbi:MAG TPA: ATP-binding protein [Vicinamibacterales bacterium]
MSGNCTVIAGSACRAIVQCLPQAVVLVDAHFRIVLANRAAASLFKRRFDQMRGALVTDLVPDYHFRLLLRSGERRARFLETSLPLDGDRRGALTLNVTIVPVGYRGDVDASRNGRPRRGGAAGVGGEFQLLVLENVSEKAMLEQQLIDSEKQAAMGQLAAGILHEVSNPLTSLGSNLAFVRDMLAPAGPADAAQALDVSLEQLHRVRQLLGTLSGVPRRPVPQFELAELHTVIRRCLAFMAKEAERRRIEIVLSLAPGDRNCEMDVRVIKQVLLNLFKNAMEAMPAGGRIGVTTSYPAGTAGEPASAVIEIADSGMGISESDLRKVFRPLFSTKPRGAGLGLSFCRQAIEEHGGAIRLTSGGGRPGTVAIVSLPLRRPVADQ